MRKGDREHFDRWAPRYDRSLAQPLFFGPVYKNALRLAASLAPAPLRVLDVGCGTGRLLRLTGQQLPAAELVGVDGSPEMIRMAQRATRDSATVRFIQGLAESLPFRDGAFDLVFSTISFHHWADQTRGLSEVSRVLAPGGVLLLADNFVIPSHRVFFLGKERRARFHTKREVEAMLSKAGLRCFAWHDLHRFGPLRMVIGVSAYKLPS
ncbi:MAG: methyltransferase domain-containing protein [Actinobacteria bacterium]|nr:methyltransferase domain-containing protein [Actinomycetota bacterium]